MIKFMPMIIIMSEELRKEIEISKQEIRNGYFKDHDTLDKQMNEWLGRE